MDRVRFGGEDLSGVRCLALTQSGTCSFEEGVHAGPAGEKGKVTVSFAGKSKNGQINY